MSHVLMHLTECEAHEVRYGLDHGHFRRRASQIAHDAGQRLTTSLGHLEYPPDGRPGMLLYYPTQPMQQSVSRP